MFNGGTGQDIIGIHNVLHSDRKNTYGKQFVSLFSKFHDKLGEPDKTGRAGNNTSNQETPDQIGKDWNVCMFQTPLVSKPSV